MPLLTDRCTVCSTSTNDSDVSNELSEVSEVCGSDGRTYPSLCQMEWEACKRNWSIQVMTGNCDDDIEMNT